MQLARFLKPFGVRPGRMRGGTTTGKGYELKDFADAFNPLPTPLRAVTPVTIQCWRWFEGTSDPSRRGQCDGSRMQLKPLWDGRCDGCDSSGALAYSRSAFWHPHRCGSVGHRDVTVELLRTRPRCSRTAGPHLVGRRRQHTGEGLRSAMTPGIARAISDHKAELVDLVATDGWPPESRDAERRFDSWHARLYFFIGRTVSTPRWAGRLVQVFPERASVILPGEAQVGLFVPEEIRRSATRLESPARPVPAVCHGPPDSLDDSFALGYKRRDVHFEIARSLVMTVSPYGVSAQ